jgi:mono/diheme cytochrome c family protein
VIHLRPFRLLGICAIIALLGFDSACLAAEPSEPPVSTGSQFDEANGELLYRGVCQGCHMAQGQGVSTGAGAYPSLRANLRLSAAAYPIYNILHGKNGMPAVGSMMTDAQVADVVNYVRTHFDNHYTDAVSAGDVKQLR